MSVVITSKVFCLLEYEYSKPKSKLPQSKLQPFKEVAKAAKFAAGGGGGGGRGRGRGRGRGGKKKKSWGRGRGRKKKG